MTREMHTSSQERISYFLNQIFRLPFGPIRFENKMEIVKKILCGSEEYGERHFFEMLGFLESESLLVSASASKSQEGNRPVLIERSSEIDRLLGLDLEDKDLIYKFIRDVFQKAGNPKLTVFDVVFKDFMSLDLMNRDSFQSYLDQHWTNILGKVALEHDSIKAMNKEVKLMIFLYFFLLLLLNKKMKLGSTMLSKIRKLIQRGLSHGSLFHNISLNHIPPSPIFSRSPWAMMENLLQTSLYRKESNLFQLDSCPLLEIPSFICNKKDYAKFSNLKSSFNQLQKKSLKHTIFSAQTTSSRKSLFGKFPIIDPKSKKDFFREEEPIWGLPGLRENFFYSVTDFFENEGFNMEYVRKIDVKEINLRKKYLTLLKNKPEYVSKEDIKRIKNLRKELRLKIKELEKKRADLLQKKVFYKLVGYKSHLKGAESPGVGLFNTKEILIARICKLNGLRHPPNYKDFLELGAKDKSDEKTDSERKMANLKQNMKRLNNSLIGNSPEMSVKMVNKYERILLHHIRSSLLDFSLVKNLSYPCSIRADQFLEMDLLPLIFQKLLFYFNPNSFAHSIEGQGDNAVLPWVEKEVDLHQQVFFVDDKNEPEQTEEERDPKEKSIEGKSPPLSQATNEGNLLEFPFNGDNTASKSHRTLKKRNRSKTEILFHFQHSDWPQLPHQKTVLILSKMDLLKNRILKTEDKLEFSNNSHLIKRAEDQTVYRISGFLPNAYYFRIFSQNKIQMMSISDFFTKVKGWSQNTFIAKSAKIIPGIPEILSRFELTLNSNDEKELATFFVDSKMNFYHEHPKKEEKPKVEKSKKQKKKKKKENKEGKLNRLHQVGKVKSQVFSESEPKQESEKPVQKKQNMKDLFNFFMETDDEFEDDRLEVGQQLGMPQMVEEKASFLSKFLFFEVVRLDPEEGSFGDRNPRSISKEGLFKDSNLTQQGRFGQSQRITVSPGKYILTIFALSPESFPEHDMEFKVTFPEQIELRHFKEQQVVDYVGSYEPNKYFSLFQDKLMFKEDYITLSFHLRLFEKKLDENDGENAKQSESQKTESKKRKRDFQNVAMETKKDFDLNSYSDISEDLHVIFEIYCHDKLLYRFGGRKSVMTCPFKLSKRGFEVTDSFSKTVSENVAKNLQKKSTQISSKEENEKVENDPMKMLEGNLDLPSRFKDIVKKPAKKDPNVEDGQKYQNSASRSWSLGDWTIKAYLDPRQNKENYVDQQKKLKSNLYRPYILDPEQIKYFDLNDMERLKSEAKIHMKSFENLKKGPTKNQKGNKIAYNFF